MSSNSSIDKINGFTQLFDLKKGLAQVLKEKVTQATIHRA
jgi:hypothetical protein